MPTGTGSSGAPSACDAPSGVSIVVEPLLVPQHRWPHVPDIFRSSYPAMFAPVPHMPMITLLRAVSSQGSARFRSVLLDRVTFYISAPSLPCYAERKTYR